MEFESDHADVAHHDAQPPFRLVKPDSPDRVNLVIRWAASMGLGTNRATIITDLFPICDGVLASIELPADLTKGEPRRLAAFWTRWRLTAPPTGTRWPAPSVGRNVAAHGRLPA